MKNKLFIVITFILSTSISNTRYEQWNIYEKYDILNSAPRISEDTKSVPMLKVILHDADKNEVQSKIAPPEGNKLPAGKRMRYKITVSEPSPKARGIAVVFVLPEDPKAE